MKHILFIIGSFRKESFNRQLAKMAEDFLKDRFKISYLDFNDIPYMNQDWEVKGQSQCLTQEQERIYRVRQEILKADGIWIFTPEYNHSYPGLLKNLFDWLSRPMDVSNFSNPTAVQGKKVTASGAGGKNKTASCRAKLNDLLEYIKIPLMRSASSHVMRC